MLGGEAAPTELEQSRYGRRMSRLRPYPVLALAIWTLVLWVGRLNLAWTATDDSTSSKVWATVPVVIFVVFAVVVAVSMWARKGAGAESNVLVGVPRLLAIGLVLWTVGYWLVRLPMILADDHALPFKLVHAVLAVGSWAFAVWAWRTLHAPGATDLVDDGGTSSFSRDRGPLIGP